MKINNRNYAFFMHIKKQCITYNIMHMKAILKY